MNRNLMTKILRLRYMEYSPRTGEEDCMIYRMLEEGASKQDVVDKCYVDITTVYRAKERIEKFLSDISNWFDIEEMYYVQPPNMILRNKTLAGDKLAILCLATHCMFGQETVNRRFVKEIENMYPGIKNKKKRLEQELLEIGWLDICSFEVTKIFADVEYDVKGLRFELTQEARDILYGCQKRKEVYYGTK